MISIKLQNIDNTWEDRKSIVFYKRITYIGSLLFLSACSTIVTISPERGIEARTIEEFNQYADNVFRRQSEANSKIIMYLIDYDTSNKTSQYERLMDAEEKIADACKQLNNMAVMHAEQREANFLQKYLYANSVGRCENATRVIEGLLPEL